MLEDKEIRRLRVAHIKKKVEQGRYGTPEKLKVACIRALEDARNTK